ncbi:hypothetical protein [Tautonia marina]|uniref:hypothetical protein n=1 Tax=Tautonia marina TaxID=2653855 RepID=UPI001260F7F2|nr:hypothetical protein [Tautonia marina]
MALWFAWLLDVRLHLSLFVVFLLTIILGDRSETKPQPVWRVERLVQRQQEYERARALALAASGDSHKETLRMAPGPAERP